MLYLVQKTQGRWCYLTILLVAVGEIIFTIEYNLPFISFLCASLGPMFAIIVGIRTRKDLDRSINIVILVIFISVCFSILIYFVGEPFISLRSGLFSGIDTDLTKETYNDAQAQGLVGLRGSIYMFGYDLSLLMAFMMGGIVENIRQNRRGYALLFFAIAAVTMVSIFINAQRVTLLIFSLLSLIISLLYRVKLRFLILVLVVSVVVMGFLFSGYVDYLTVMDRLSEKRMDDSATFRLYLIETALYAVKVQPLAPEKVYNLLAPTIHGQPLPPHVHFLTVVIRYSILAVPFVLYLLWKLGGSIVSALRYSDNRSMIMLAFGMVASLIYGLFHNPGPWLMTPSGVLLLALYGKCLDFRLFSGKNGTRE
jgi:hypothetical protein